MRSLALALAVSMIFIFAGCRLGGRLGGGCQVSVEEVQKTLEKDDQVLIVYGQEGCPPCQLLKAKVMLSPRIQIAARQVFKEHIYLVDIHDPRIKELVQKADIRSTPTVIRYKIKDGQYIELKRFVGNKPVAEILDFIRTKDFAPKPIPVH